MYAYVLQILQSLKMRWHIKDKRLHTPAENHMSTQKFQLWFQGRSQLHWASNPTNIYGIESALSAHTILYICIQFPVIASTSSTEFRTCIFEKHVHRIIAWTTNFTEMEFQMTSTVLSSSKQWHSLHMIASRSIRIQVMQSAWDSKND